MSETNIQEGASGDSALCPAESITAEATQKEPEEKQQQVTEEAVDEGGLFECRLCNLRERYHGSGTSVPFARGIRFSEHAYVMRDPFTPYAANAYLFLGAECSSCRDLVCASCSVFYTKRFCRNCAQRDIAMFPIQVQKKIRDLESKT